MVESQVVRAGFWQHIWNHGRLGAFRKNQDLRAGKVRKRVRLPWRIARETRPCSRAEPGIGCPDVSPRWSLPARQDIATEAFPEFDAVYAAALLGLDDQPMGQTSCRKNSSSPVKEPTPISPILLSIDAVVTDLPSPDIVSKISTLKTQDWQAKYKPLRQLTPGNQGAIEFYHHRLSKKLLIVKKLKVSNEIPLEATILKDHLKPHPNIVELYDIFYDRELNICNVAMEYCSGGDLFDFTSHWLYEKKEQIPELFMLHFIASIGEALGYLHLGRRYEEVSGVVGMPSFVEDKSHLPILHRDIKLDNIFLRWSPNSKYDMPDVVLGDFGGAVLESESSGGFGTPGYYPPEVLRFQNTIALANLFSLEDVNVRVMTKASDIYTLGACLCCMMLWGDYVQGMDIGPAFARSNLRRWPLLLDLLEGCLADDPQKRPTTQTLFNWAAVLETHVRYLYDSGVRMPENSWAKTRFAVEVGNKAMSQGLSASSCPRTEKTVLSKCSVDTLHNDLSSSVSSPSMEIPRVSTAKVAQVQKANLVSIKKLSAVVRTSALYRIVENMANNLLGNKPVVQGERFITSNELSTHAVVGSRGQRGSVRLVSRFSSDGDLGGVEVKVSYKDR